MNNRTEIDCNVLQGLDEPIIDNIPTKKIKCKLTSLYCVRIYDDTPVVLIDKNNKVNSNEYDESSCTKFIVYKDNLPENYWHCFKLVKCYGGYADYYY